MGGVSVGTERRRKARDLFNR